ncbi:lysine-specific demethylase 8 [Fusarium heterosporum]|uniref:Lysine-specific demethylase 8 n=1 Tax=Fusarium heterosporum TaxID=42747 RepID=A0A8H5TEA5_FUSHE|nr:lysine-specific demethylase 8 [Fusarium heterosporum]
MNKVFSASPPWTRYLPRIVPSCRYVTETTMPSKENVVKLDQELEEHTTFDMFRKRAFEPKKPVLFAKDRGAPTSLLPALDKWFTEDSQCNSTTLSRHFNQFHDAMVTYEIYAPTSVQRESLELFRESLSNGGTQDEAILRCWDLCFADSPRDNEFFRLHAPLRLFIKILEFNEVLQMRNLPRISIYIAQSSITDLPSALQEDIPTPELVKQAGKGDIYGSSIWLGITPTYTPLHRDPNPNLFCQLHGTKVIRLMPPKVGDRLFSLIQTELHRSGSSRIRTEEMMQGEERDKLHSAVWETDHDKPVPRGTLEAVLNPGDAMFIPSHYWHSVKSVGNIGQLNGSVNWWFR